MLSISGAEKFQPSDGLRSIIYKFMHQNENQNFRPVNGGVAHMWKEKIHENPLSAMARFCVADWIYWNNDGLRFRDFTIATKRTRSKFTTIRYFL